MKKFNGFEAHLLEQGLKMCVDGMVKDIENGQASIITAGYLEMTHLEVLSKLKSLTIKQ